MGLNYGGALFQAMEDAKCVSGRAKELTCQQSPQIGLNATFRDEEKHKRKTDAKRRSVDKKRKARVPEAVQDA